MSQQFKFEAVITFEDEGHDVDEDFLDLVALYYGDKHQEFTLSTIADSIEEIK